MTYVFDKVLSPPQTPLSTNIPGDTISEKEALPEHFDGHLSAGWKVVYRQDYEQHQKVFLCSNWAYLRLDDKLKPNQMFPYDDQDPDDTTGYTVDEYVKKLDREFGLVVCDFDDPARFPPLPLFYLIKYFITDDRTEIDMYHLVPGGSHKSVGHIQVKYNGNWESKISTEYWVITHGEDDFQYLTNGNLVKMQAFKRG